MNLLRSLPLLVALLAAPLFADPTPAQNDAVAKAQAALDAAKAAATSSTATAIAIPSKSDEVLAFILKKAESYSDSLEIAIGKGVDFAKKESPVLIEQFLTVRFYETLWDLVFWGGLFTLCVVAFLSVYKWGMSWIGDVDGRIITLMTIGIAGGFLFLATIHSFSIDVPILLKIHFAPHVYLVEEAMKLVHR